MPDTVTTHIWIADIWPTLRSTMLAPGGWLVPVLHDHDLAIRDGRAYALLMKKLGPWPDVVEWFVPAWKCSREEPPMPVRNVMFLGRAKATASCAAIGAQATWLESNAHGRFDDKPDGRAADSVRYRLPSGEEQVFTCHELERRDQVRRCDRDYGVLLMRRGQVLGVECLVIGIGGLRTLGTLLLTIVLCDDALRAELARKVQALLPWRSGMRPEDSAEVCVEFVVDGSDALTNILNRPVFTFEVVAAAVAGADPAVRISPLREGVLFPDGNGGGTLRAQSFSAIQIPRARYELLRQLVEQPRECTVADLCRELKITERALRVRIHHLNDDLHPLLRGLDVRRVVQKDRADGRYHLVKNIRITLAAAETVT